MQITSVYRIILAHAWTHDLIPAIHAHMGGEISVMASETLIAGYHAQKQHARSQENRERQRIDCGLLAQMLAQYRPIDRDMAEAQKNEREPDPLVNIHNTRKLDMTK